jgi:hypothetical protein
MLKTLAKFFVVICGFAVLVGTYVYTEDTVETVLRDSITKTTQASNAAITRIFVNELFPELELVLDITVRTEGLAGEELAFVDTKVRTFMLGSDILKTKIFNLDGITLYSTEHKQIGETRKNNSAFQQAAKGGMGSQITHKGKFSAIDEIVFERDLVASYVPVRDQAGLVVGVVEIYTDRTNEVARIPAHLSMVKTVLMIALSLAALVMAIQFWHILFLSHREEE